VPGFRFVIEDQVEDADHERDHVAGDDGDDLQDGDGLDVELAGRGAHQLCAADDLEDAEDCGQDRDRRAEQADTEGAKDDRGCEPEAPEDVEDPVDEGHDGDGLDLAGFGLEGCFRHACSL